jgi:hypothetical protein
MILFTANHRIKENHEIKLWIKAGLQYFITSLTDLELHTMLTCTLTGESGQKPLQVRSRSDVAMALTSNSASTTAVWVEANRVSPWRLELPKDWQCQKEKKNVDSNILYVSPRFHNFYKLIHLHYFYTLINLTCALTVCVFVNLLCVDFLRPGMSSIFLIDEPTTKRLTAIGGINFST